jgi:GNAT superfamily N-acetyltransferase
MLEFRLMQTGNETDISDLFTLLKQAEAYSILVEGAPPSIEDAHENLSELPPGKTAADKCFYGIWQAGCLIGCADLIRGYPEPDIAYLGLLLFADSNQGKGHGVQALNHLFRLARGCARMRLGVIAGNVRGLSFWKREGFGEIYRKSVEGFTGEVIVMQKEI